MSRLLPLLRRERADAGVLALSAALATLVAVNAFEHLRLYGTYAGKPVVGPGFLVNGIAGALLVAVLLAGRVRLFLLGATVFNVVSLAAILLSRTSLGLFGFHEEGYEGVDGLVLRMELVSLALLALTAAVVAAGSRRPSHSAVPVRARARRSGR